MQYPKCTAFGLPQIDVYHLKCEKKTMPSAVNFDTNWTTSYFFSWIYCRRFSQNRFSQTFSTFTKTFHRFARTTKSELGFMLLTEMLPRAVGSNSAYTHSPIGRPAKVFFGCRKIFFQLVLTFARSYYDSHYLENCIKGVFTSVFHSLQKTHVT